MPAGSCFDGKRYLPGMGLSVLEGGHGAAFFDLFSQIAGVLRQV